MKEVTREDWKKNPTPRLMWVWDGNKENKKKRLVVHCLTCKDDDCCFVAEDRNGRSINYWMHCAEIETSKDARMTNYELAKWLYEGASCGEFREWRRKDGYLALHDYSYRCNNENEPCDEDICIRSNGGEWREPYNIPPECISPTPDEIGG